MKKFIILIITFLISYSISNADFMPIGSVGSQFPSNLVKEKLHEKYPETKNIYCHDYRASYDGVMVWCSGKEYKLTGNDLKDNNTTCIKEGENISDTSNQACCEGLTKIIPSSNYKIEKRDGKIFISYNSNGGGVCANISDGICNMAYENEFNSPNDCEIGTSTGSGTTNSGTTEGSGSTTQTGSCINEGQEINSEQNCCSGLAKSPSKDSYTASGTLKSTVTNICIKKGDGVCSNFENNFNSPDDCPSSNSGTGTTEGTGSTTQTGSTKNITIGNIEILAIKDQEVSYNEAKEICTNSGAQLASYSDIIKILSDESINGSYTTLKEKLGLSDKGYYIGSTYYTDRGLYWLENINNRLEIKENSGRMYTYTGNDNDNKKFKVLCIKYKNSCKKEFETFSNGVYSIGQMPQCCSGLKAVSRDNNTQICINENDGVCGDYETTQNSRDCSGTGCVAEGHEINSNQSCCSGLAKSPSIDSYTTNGALKSTVTNICIKKGDGVCSSFENKFNSPDDCTSSETGTGSTTQTGSCINEVKEISDNETCCSGLIKVYSGNSYNIDGNLKSNKKRACIKKGDNRCGKYENVFNSQNDCGEATKITLTNDLKEKIQENMIKYLEKIDKTLNTNEQIEKLETITSKLNILETFKPKYKEITSYIYSLIEDQLIILKIKQELSGN